MALLKSRMDQNRYTRTLSESVDNEDAEPVAKRRRVNDDDDLSGKTLAEIIFAIRESASYFEREIGRIADLTRAGPTLHRIHNAATDALYIFEKKRRPTGKFDPVNGEPLFYPEFSWSPADTTAITPLLKKLEAAKPNMRVSSADGHYVGTRYVAPFAIQWTKNESDDIRLAESITGATTSDMKTVLDNYAEYVDFCANNRRWKSLFLKMIDAELDHRYGEAINTNVVRLPTIATVRAEVANVLRQVNNTDEKMSTLYTMIGQNSDLSPQQREAEAQAIIHRFHEEVPVDDGGRLSRDLYGTLECQNVAETFENRSRLSAEAANDLDLVNRFRAIGTNGKIDETKRTYQARVQALNTYLTKHLRFVFSTSQLPLYVPKPHIEFTDKWKGLIRDSMVRYTTGSAYAKAITSYRDLLLPEPNDPIIALFAEFVSNRTDNTQVVMRPLNANGIALTRFQLSHNTVQYKAKEREMDNAARALLPRILKEKASNKNIY